MASKLAFKSHIFLCVSQKAKCAARESLDASWRHLKDVVAKQKLGLKVGRTQANCLQICKDGPIAVVFDKNGSTWYNKATPEVLDRIIEEHLKQGCLVEDHIIAQNEEFFFDRRTTPMITTDPKINDLL